MVVIRILTAYLFINIPYKKSIDYCQCFFLIKMFYQNNSSQNVSNGKYYKLLINLDFIFVYDRMFY